MIVLEEFSKGDFSKGDFSNGDFSKEDFSKEDLRRDLRSALARDLQKEYSRRSAIEAVPRKEILEKRSSEDPQKEHPE